METAKPSASSTVAPRTRNGITTWKVRTPVCSRRNPPVNPPSNEGPASNVSVRRVPLSSRRNPTVADTYPGHSASVLVALATMGLRPVQTSVGNVIRVPPPATEFTPPASRAATRTMGRRHRCTRGGYPAPMQGRERDGREEQAPLLGLTERLDLLHLLLRQLAGDVAAAHLVALDLMTD